MTSKLANVSLRIIFRGSLACVCRTRILHVIGFYVFGRSRCGLHHRRACLLKSVQQCYHCLTNLGCGLFQIQASSGHSDSFVCYQVHGSLRIWHSLQFLGALCVCPRVPASFFFKIVRPCIQVRIRCSHLPVINCISLACFKFIVQFLLRICGVFLYATESFWCLSAHYITIHGTAKSARQLCPFGAPKWQSAYAYPYLAPI